EFFEYVFPPVSHRRMHFSRLFVFHWGIHCREEETSAAPSYPVREQALWVGSAAALHFSPRQRKGQTLFFPSIFRLLRVLSPLPAPHLSDFLPLSVIWAYHGSGGLTHRHHERTPGRIPGGRDRPGGKTVSGRNREAYIGRDEEICQSLQASRYEPCSASGNCLFFSIVRERLYGHVSPSPLPIQIPREPSEQ